VNGKHGLELTVFMHMPEHTEIRKGRYGVIASGISGLGTTVLHSQPWPFLVQMSVSLVSAAGGGGRRVLFSGKHSAAFTDDSCVSSVPGFVSMEDIDAAAAAIAADKLPFHGDNGLRIEVCLQVSSLGDAESSLGDAKSSLGDAKSSLGDAESSLGER
jgi:hypothetical protein